MTQPQLEGILHPPPRQQPGKRRSRQCQQALVTAQHATQGGMALQLQGLHLATGEDLLTGDAP